MAGRASSLQELQAFIPEQSGTSGVMPRWADLHIYVMANFDLGSAITFAMGLDAFGWNQDHSATKDLALHIRGNRAHLLSMSEICSWSGENVLIS